MNGDWYRCIFVAVFKIFYSSIPMNLVNLVILSVCAVSLAIVFYTSTKDQENKGAK